MDAYALALPSLTKMNEGGTDKAEEVILFGGG